MAIYDDVSDRNLDAKQLFRFCRRDLKVRCYWEGDQYYQGLSVPHTDTMSSSSSTSITNIIFEIEMYRVLPYEPVATHV